MLAATDRDPQDSLGPSVLITDARPSKKWRSMRSWRDVIPRISRCARGVEALCEEKFCLHGINVTTFSATPMTIINGPMRQQIGVNCGHNALGHGFRANATIGRTFRLMIINIGGAKPHEITKATMGHPAQYTFCVGENEEESPWDPLHVEKGFRPEQSTVTLFGGHSPLQINDHASRMRNNWRSPLAGRWPDCGITKISRSFRIPCWSFVRNTPRRSNKMVGRKTICASFYLRRSVARYVNSGLE